MSWDEKYYHKIGEINLKYLLSFGMVEENFDQKFRFSTLYWSLSSLLSQLAPEKYSVEIHHVINTIFGLLIFIGVYQVTKQIFNKSVAKISAFFFYFCFPFFFGHLAINNKDIIITFSHIWIINYLIKYSVKNLYFKTYKNFVQTCNFVSFGDWYSAFIFRFFGTYSNNLFNLFNF